MPVDVGAVSILYGYGSDCPVKIARDAPIDQQPLAIGW